MLTTPRTEDAACELPSAEVGQSWSGSPRSESLRTRVALGLVVFASTMLAYLPANSQVFGRLDDYVALTLGRSFSLGEESAVWFKAGRLVPALIGPWLFSMVDSVADLQHLRLLSTAVIAAAGVFLALWCLWLVGPASGTVGKLLAVAVGLVPGFLPASTSVATWAIFAPQALALVFALAAGAVIATARRLGGLPWYAVAGALLLLSAFTYQTFAVLAMLPPLMLSSLRWARRQDAHWTRPFVAALMTACALLVNYAFIVVVGGTDRLHKASSHDMLVWFFEQFLPRSIDFGIPMSSTSVWLTTGVLLVLLLSPLVAGPRYLAVSLAGVVAWLGSSVVVLGAGVPWASYRLVLAAQLALWVSAAFAFMVAVCDGPPALVRSPARLAGLVLGVCLSALAVAGHRGYAYIAVPSAIDWASTACVVRQLPDGVTKDVAVVLNTWPQARSEVITMDEYGVISTSTPYGLRAMVWEAARETGDEGQMPRVPPGDVRVLQPEAAPGRGTTLVRIPQDLCGSLR